MAEIVWEEPPKKHRRSEWTAWLLEVKAGSVAVGRQRWAKAGQYDTSREAEKVASAIRSAASALGGGWEVVTRTLPTGGAGVWASYWLADIPEADSDRPDASADYALPGVNLGTGGAIKYGGPPPVELLLTGPETLDSLGEHPPIGV